MSPDVESPVDGSVVYKDVVLDRLARTANVAQFVSFDPALNVRFSWVRGREPNAPFASVEEACEALLRAADAHAVNVRSYKPDDSKGYPLAFNLTSAGAIAGAVRERAGRGLFTIANELIAVDEGGVSGVAVGDVIEFAPDDTPKCVDKQGVASLPREDGMRMLELIYGFRPAIDFGADTRVEFSIHPLRRGLRHEHTIVWELEPSQRRGAPSVRTWPNRFSRFLGDKVYGLLIACGLGFDVPRTTVIARRVAPFAFGEGTGTNEIWLRTCPSVPVPGKYVTDYGWRDPYALLAEDDPTGEAIASVIAQESVEFAWSGAGLTTDAGAVIEGHPGRGDAFMLGRAKPVPLPRDVAAAVERCHGRLTGVLESVKFEWVWDGTRVWIVQLHRRPKASAGAVIREGEAERYVTFDASRTLEELRALVQRIAGTRTGVLVSGEIGVTSHIGDILTSAGVPSRIVWTEADDPSQLSIDV